MDLASSWTESIQRWRWSLVGLDGVGWVAVLSVGTVASVLNIMLCCIVGDPRHCVDGEGRAAMLSIGTAANVSNIMLRCMFGGPRHCADGVAGCPSENKGLLGAREIAAIVSVNVLLLSERSLFESARTRRSSSSACNSSLVL